MVPTVLLVVLCSVLASTEKLTTLDDPNVHLQQRSLHPIRGSSNNFGSPTIANATNEGTRGGTPPTVPFNSPMYYVGNSTGVNTHSFLSPMRTTRNPAKGPILRSADEKRTLAYQESKSSPVVIDISHRSKIPFNKLGVSEIQSPLYQLQQMLMTPKTPTTKNHFAPTPVASAEEYFWESEGDADYLIEKMKSNPSIMFDPPRSRSPTGIPSSSDSPIDTYNIVITKNSSRRHQNNRVKLLQDSQVVAHHVGPSDTPDVDLESIVRNAVEATVNNNPSTIEETVAQVVERPGSGATVNVINSTIGDVAEIEDAINTLLGTEVVYRSLPVDERSPHRSLDVGYLNNTSSSFVDRILNETVGHPTNHSKTNVVNIFIINVVSESKETLSGTVEPDNDVVDDDDEPRRSSIVPMRNNEQTFYDSQHIVVANTPVVPPNTEGLTLNENKVLNLLPDFVRATTISPMVPLFNTEIHKELGTKPSILGLLPNEVFDIKRKMGSEGNEYHTGIVRKDGAIFNPFEVFDFITGDNSNEESNFDNFRANSKENYIEHSEDVLLPSETRETPTTRISIVPVPQLIFKSNNVQSAGPVQNNRNDDQVKTSSANFDALLHRNGALVSENSPVHNNGSANKTKKSQQKKKNVKRPYQFTEFFQFHKNPKKSKTSIETIEPKQEKVEKDGDGGMKMDSMVKAFAIGALPSGVAVASALWPVWAPMIFGKKRRKRDASESSNRSKDWYSLLNGSKYYSTVMDKSRTDETKFASSDLAELVKLASIRTTPSDASRKSNKNFISVANFEVTKVSPNSRVSSKKTTDEITTDKTETVEITTAETETDEFTTAETEETSTTDILPITEHTTTKAPTTEPTTKKSPSLEQTTKKLPITEQTTKKTGEESSRQYTMKTTTSDFIKSKLESLKAATRSSHTTTEPSSSVTKSENYKTSSSAPTRDYTVVSTAASATQDKLLVNNFLTAAVSGWMHFEKPEESEHETRDEITNEEDYITFDMSSVAPVTVTGMTDSPIILINKENGFIKPFKIIRKDSTTSTTTTTTASPTTTSRKRFTPVIRQNAPAAAVVTTTTTTTPAPSPASGSSIFDQMSNTLSFVGTVVLYSAAALSPVLVPWLMGKKKRRKRSYAFDVDFSYDDFESLPYSEIGVEEPLSLIKMDNRKKFTSDTYAQYEKDVVKSNKKRVVNKKL